METFPKLFVHKSVVFFRHVVNYSLLCIVFTVLIFKRDENITDYQRTAD